jgi:hypothetical protein
MNRTGHDLGGKSEKLHGLPAPGSLDSRREIAMKRNRLVPYATAMGCAIAAAILAGGLFISTPACAGIDVRISIGNAPPAPHLVFRSQPRLRLIPGQRIYVVDDPGVGDNDCFRYGGYYWVFRDGYWYRAPSWRSRFVVVDPRYVPTVFYHVPPAHWKHAPNGPPRFANNRSGRSPMPVNRGGGGPAGPPQKGGKAGDKPGNRGGK